MAFGVYKLNIPPNLDPNNNDTNHRSKKVINLDPKRILKPPSLFTSCDASLNRGLLIFVSATSTSFPVSSFFLSPSHSTPLAGCVVRGQVLLFLLLFCLFRGPFAIANFCFAGTYPASNELPAQPFSIFFNFARAFSTPTSRIRVTVYSVHRPCQLFIFSSLHSFSNFIRLKHLLGNLPVDHSLASHENQCPAGSGC